MLPSQSTRATDRRRYMYRNQRSRTSLWIGGIVGLVLIITAWQVLTPEDDESDAGAGGTSSDGSMATGGTGDEEHRLLPAVTLTSTSRDGDAAAAPATEVTGEPERPLDRASTASARLDTPAAAPSPDDPSGSGGSGESGESIAMGEAIPEHVSGNVTSDAADPAPDPARGATTDPAPDPAIDPAPDRPHEPVVRAVPRPLQLAAELVSQRRYVDAREILSDALMNPGQTAAIRAEIRRMLGEINQELVFGREAHSGDPYSFRYVVQPGDSLSKIAKRLSLQVDWRFIQRVNRIADPQMVRAGDPIKIVTGPFHAVVDKRRHRLDLYLGELDEGPVYVRSFMVGLGEFNSTPVGRFRVRPRSKLIDPAWVNPRTRERFAADNPDNPIGERWIGLEGLDAQTRDLQGYGIHGTIDPGSIGKDASMGCVRLLPDDVAVVYELLVEEVSAVNIVAGE